MNRYQRYSLEAPYATHARGAGRSLWEAELRELNEDGHWPLYGLLAESS